MTGLLVDPVPIGIEDVEFEAVTGEIGVLLLDRGDDVTPVLNDGELEALMPVLNDDVGYQGL